MSQTQRVIATCLGAVLVSLLLVGIVSATFLPHVIQVLPIAVALVAITSTVLCDHVTVARGSSRAVGRSSHADHTEDT
jgi:hypothetical protein